MTVTEMLDYVSDYTNEGITLTESGRNAAAIILERRSDWTESHRLMLDRITAGVSPLPLKLGRLVNRTRLGDALELARKVTRKSRKNQKCKARRKAAKARRAARAAA